MSELGTEQVIDEPISEANQEESLEEDGLDQPPYEQEVYDDAYDEEVQPPDVIHEQDDGRLAEIQVLEHAQPKEASLVMPTLPEREEIERVRERAQQAA